MFCEEEEVDQVVASVTKKRVNRDTQEIEYWVTWKPSQDSLDEGSWWSSWCEEEWLLDNFPEAKKMYQQASSASSAAQKKKQATRKSKPAHPPAGSSELSKGVPEPVRDLHKIIIGSPFKRLYVLCCHGSFNPPHKNHLRMMEEAVKVMEATEGGGVARVIGAFFLPSATCAVQKKLGAGAGLPGETRVKMLREVLRGHPLVGVDGWLAEQPGNPGAAAAVRELTEAVREVAGRGVEIVQVCGADLFPKLKNFFSEKKPVVCIVDRPADYDVEAFALQKRKEGARIWVHRMEGEGMSSTEVRNAWRQKNMDVLREMLPEAILQFHERYGISYGEEDRGRYANPEANITTARGKREAGEAYQRAQEMISRYQIPLEEDLTLFPRSSLGEGITGEVIKGQRRTGKEVACKILEFGRGTPRDAQNLVQTLKSECEAAVRLRHKDLTHLVPLESHFLDAPSLILVTIMPLFHCSLKHHLESPAGRRFQPSSRLFPSPFSYQVLLHVALGMSELHSAGILHRDLCATNILLEWSPEGEGREGGSLLRAAVCDFGLSLHKSFPMSSAMRGSLLHYAPEAAASKGTYLEASDVFMWAYMGVEMSSCAEVWRGMGKQAAIERTGQGERPEEQAGDRVPWFKKLQEASWSQEHANRPSFEKIVRIFQENESS